MKLLLTLVAIAGAAWAQPNAVARQGTTPARYVVVDTDIDDAYVGSPSNNTCPASLAAPTVVELIVSTTNTGSATLNFCGFGALEITTTTTGTDLSNGDLVVGKVYTLSWYDATPDLWLVNLGQGGAGGGYATVEDEGTPLTQRTNLNFAGAGVSCADDTTKTTCTISGGGGSPLTVQEQDGTPSVSSVTTIQVDQADGFILTDNTGGSVRIDLGTIPEARIDSAIARDSEINVQGAASEITSSGAGVSPTLSLATQLALSSKEIMGDTPLQFEGATDNNIYTRFAITDPTIGNKTVTVPNADTVIPQSYTCSAQFPRSLNGTTGATTCSSIVDADVPDTITLTNITQITNRAISDTTGDLAASRVDDGGVASTQALFSGAGAAAGFRAIADGDIPAAIARDSEINIQGTASEITSSGSGVAPTLSIADSFRITGKTVTAPVKTGTALPGTCTVGDFFFDTDATAGQNTYACTATNTWTLQGDGGGASSEPYSCALDNDLSTTCTHNLNTLKVTWNCWDENNDGFEPGVPTRALNSVTFVFSVAPTTGSVCIINGGSGPQGPAGPSVTVREVDLAPSVSSVNTEEFNQADGFVVSDQTGGVVRVGLGTIPESKIDSAITRDSEAAAAYAPIANGVTNGNSHDHNGGDGAQIAFSSLSGAASDAQVPDLNTLSTGVTASRCVETTGAALFTASAALCLQLATAGSAGTSATNAGTATTAARSDHEHLEPWQVGMFFEVTPATGEFAMPLPANNQCGASMNVNSVSITALTKGTTFTFNVARYTNAGTSVGNLFSATQTYNTGGNNRQGFTPNQNQTGITNTDYFRVNIVSITGTDDFAVTVQGTCKNR